MGETVELLIKIIKFYNIVYINVEHVVINL